MKNWNEERNDMINEMISITKKINEDQIEFEKEQAKINEMLDDMNSRLDALLG